jgi:hypothetical protein
METSNLQADSKSLDTLPIESRYSCDQARANNQSRHIAKCNENQGEIGISQTMMPGAAIHLAPAKKIIPHARSRAGMALYGIRNLISPKGQTIHRVPPAVIRIIPKYNYCFVDYIVTTVTFF